MKVLITLAFLFLSIAICVAQEEPYKANPCKGGNKRIKELLNGAVLMDEIHIACGGAGGYSQLGTSMLKNTAKSPAKPDYAGLNAEQQDAKKQAYEALVDTWSCLYSPANLTDSNTATAWVEGVEGNGIGELVIAEVDVSKQLQIWGGFGKSESLYKQNSRPKKIRLHIIRVKLNPSECGSICQEMALTASSSPVDLKDINGYQILPPIPGIRNKAAEESAGYSFWLGIEILEAYAGSKYADLCISEVSALN